MDLLPSRRGWVHYTALALGLAFALLGIVPGVSSCGRGLEIHSDVRKQLSEIAKTGAPIRFPAVKEFFQQVRGAQKGSLKAAWGISDVFEGLLVCTGLFTLAGALTLPGKSALPRYSELRRLPDPRRPAWVDAFLVAAFFALFEAEGSLLATLGSRAVATAVLPSDPGRARAFVQAELRMMDLESYLPLATAVLGLLAFTLLTYRLARRLWKGIRDERKRRQGEADALAMEQF
jgi:hypothetical protein